MKTFANVSDLLKQATGRNLYVKLSNGYYAPVSKKDLKKIAKSMDENEVKFCGNIISDGMAHTQIELI